MASLIHELDNESVLLLYAAGELPGEDRAEVEQMLATDAGLRATLLAVQHDGAAATRALVAADHVDPPAASPSAASVALRRVDRAIRQWQANHLVRPRPAAVPERQPRLPVWAYPAGVAAAVLIGTVSWWGLRPETAERIIPTPLSDEVAQRMAGDRGGDDNRDGAREGRGLPAPGILAAAAADGFGGGGGGGPDASELTDAERQARTLARADDDAAPTTPPVVRDGQTD